MRYDPFLDPTLPIEIEPEELGRLFSGISTTPIAVGRVEAELARRIGASRREVWLSRETAVKQLSKHRELEIDHYLALPTIIADASTQSASRLLRRATLTYDSYPLFGKASRIAVKATGNGCEVYLVSFHLLTKRRLIRNAPGGQ